MTTPAVQADDNPGSLHPRIAELIAELDASRRALHALLAELPAPLRDAPAVGDRWSVAQILEHLSIVEDGAGRLVSKIIHEVEATGARDTDTSSILGVNDRFQIATNDMLIAAPERVRPTGGVAYEEALARLETARERLKVVLRRASGLDLGAASMPHPLFGPFTGYQWTLATAQHERRHIRQLRRLMDTNAS